MDEEHPSTTKRAGAHASRTAAGAPAPSVPASASTVTPPSIERLLKRKAKPLPAALFLKVAEWVLSERKTQGLTQKAMGLRFGVPERQVATYEAVARWPAEAKALLRGNPASFRTRELVRLFANRSWRSKETLLNALQRHIEGKPPRKKRQVSTAQRSNDPDLLALQDRLRDRLQTRVELFGDGVSGELRIRYFAPAELERLLEILGA